MCRWTRLRLAFVRELHHRADVGKRKDPATRQSFTIREHQLACDLSDRQYEADLTRSHLVDEPIDETAGLCEWWGFLQVIQGIARGAGESSSALAVRQNTNTVATKGSQGRQRAALFGIERQ
jgi:hypothetical protein